MRVLTYTGLLLLAVQCSAPEALPTGLVAQQAMVVSARVEASQIGMEILRKGGNAFDAMVATEMALAVAFPFAGNLGGGGFMVYRKANGDTGSLDYRERAPLAAQRDMYLDSLGDVIPERSLLGATAVAVPGTVAGIFEVHDKYGTLPVAELLEPAITLAENGVVVTEYQAERLAKYREYMLEVNGENTLFYNVCKAGDTLRYPALANTLRRIVKNGRDEFYRGETAGILARFIQENGGYLTEEDLMVYEPVWRQPVIFRYKALRVISMPPPSSGGVALSQILRMIAPYEIGAYGHNSPKAIQLFTEASKRAYADRNHFLGDPDYVDIPLDVLLGERYLEARMEDFSFDHATASAAISPGRIPQAESAETTHYSIVDPYGNAVSVTTTLNGAYGSKLYCDELGFFLNNEMDDFSAKPGVPNMFGLTGGEANSIAPGKRMLSSMTPTIVEKDGALWMVLGTKGGSTIITAVGQAILNVYEFGLSMQEAADAPRFQHQWVPDDLLLEPGGFSESRILELRAKGYQVKEAHSPISSRINAIRVLGDKRLEAGADHRGDNAAAGY